MTATTTLDPALARGIDPQIVHSIRRASETSSADFGLLMAQAAQESSFHSEAKSATSSAAGLFQFVDSTWLDMVRRFGAKYGIGELAQQVIQSSAGKAVVNDAATRKRILDLRQDPSLASALAGEYAKLNESEIARALGHGLQRADLYMAHFLGASGAATFLKAVETKGGTVAAELLPEAAAANRGVFYDAQTGKARTVAEIYRSFASKIEKEATAWSGAVAPEVATRPETAAIADAMTAPIAPSKRALDWSPSTLSTSILDMLNVVALAALQLASKDTPSSALLPVAKTTERRSI